MTKQLKVINVLKKVLGENTEKAEFMIGPNIILLDGSCTMEERKEIKRNLIKAFVFFKILKMHKAEYGIHIF